MFICSSLLTIASTAFVFRLGWYLCLFIFLAYFIASLGLMRRTHRLTTDPMTLTKVEQQKIERDGLTLHKDAKHVQNNLVNRDVNSIEVPLPRFDDDINWEPPTKGEGRHRAYPEEAQPRAGPDDDRWRRL